METVPNDSVLWTRTLAGEGDAFAAIFDAHRSRLYRAALRGTRGASDAEDAVAAVFLELWRRRSVVRLVDDSLLPWLLTTLLNVTRNLERAQRRHASFLARLPAPTTERSAEEMAIEDLARLESSRRVSQLMMRLRPADAQILELVHLEELDLATVAQVLGLSASAARQRLARARARAQQIERLPDFGYTYVEEPAS